MTTLPAVVRIIDLPAATTVTGGELWEVIQTVGGVQISVQIPATAVMTTAFGALPTGGGTGQLLSKVSGTNFSANWSSITSFVGVNSTGALGTSGSATSVLFGVTANAITSSHIANNAIGTNQLASSIGIASTLSVGTLLTVGGTATFNGTAILNATAILGNGLQVTGTALLTGVFGVVGTATFTGAFNVVGTALVTGNLNLSGRIAASIGSAVAAGGTAILLASSTAAFGIYIGTGVPSVSAATGSIYLRSDGATATSRLYVNNSGTGVWTGVTTVA